ncbi:cytochrome b [Novosphingobium terrae]|uniref:cytochrome b n=1 Tax=Novosphingobium terrae TaxID=2726189 RepID=UPI00197CDE31|nr:cytochrome b [Novosphingobium terrae]
MNAPAQRYNRGARLLHWTIALLIIANILIGIAHAYVNKDWPVIPLHKSIGLTVLALTLLRIVWRLTHRPPALPVQMPGWEKGAAHGLHGLFYALMLVLPLTGWVMSSAGQYPLRWFNLFAVPKFAVAKGSALVEVSRGSHGVLGLVFGALIVLHMAAALRHHFVLKDGILQRMIG